VLWKNCGRMVETLWTRGHAKIFRSRFRPKRADRTSDCQASYDASLVSANSKCESRSSLPTTHHTSVTHRYEEHIAGRTYQIEVRAVSQSRWRAQIVRLPGLPTSMMPFYGSTPEQAAKGLSRWLSLVYNGTTKQ
jgi:hypothetical protein